MAVIMKMYCEEVTERGGGVLLPLCRAHEVLEAWPPAEEHLSTTGIYHHGIDPDEDGLCSRCSELSRDITRLDGLTVSSYYNPKGKGSESITLKAVKGNSEDNAEWAAATPSGELTCTIDNPGAWDFYEVGVDYIVEIRRHVPSRGNRASSSDDDNGGDAA